MSIRFVLEVACDNAAFDPEPRWELACILRSAADRLEERGIQDRFSLLDINGNEVGEARLDVVYDVE
jgi:hypothetical protein